MTQRPYDQYLGILRNTAIEAGEKIMAIREGRIGVSYKEDCSPVTLADQAAEKIILRDLRKIAPEIPIIAEESASNGHIPKVNDKFWLVDPLDGTKEFIAGGTDFTVNIGLIENGIPTFGIIYTPASGDLYIAKNPTTATVQKVKGGKIIGDEKRIKVRRAKKDNLTALASKSHLDEKTKVFLDNLNVKHKTSAGSSLKFCVVATGKADIYPRFGPTMEWDIAAGHAILNAAGGSVTNPDGTPFKYNKPEFRNGPFIAMGNIKL
ncbi:MAG: 3'(2'),5'-bisphosphate nucleotidase CysQ [Kordiimonadaceae bacterium]|nr:3'(2'),5'-bisphosphate nucleotidase CysQ [Kordiimonadaceae bacterium]